MIDLEHELRALLERRGAEVWLAPAIPPAVLRRARARRVRNAVAGSAASVVIAAGAFAGVRGLVGSKGAMGPQVARVASAQLGVSVARPAGWRVSFGGEQAEGRTHLLTLSNGPLPVVTAAATRGCAPVPPTLGQGLGPGQQVLYVLELSRAEALASGEPFTVAFGGTGSPFTHGDYPCFGPGGLLRLTRADRYFEVFLAGGSPPNARATALMLTAVRSLQFQPPRAASSPGPSLNPVAVFGGIWPEDTPGELAAAQRSVDAGHRSWRRDPVQVVLAFARAQGWPATSATPARPGVYRVAGARAGSLLEVTVAQPGRSGANGVWVVTRVTSLAPGITFTAAYVPGNGGSAAIAFRGSATDLADGTTLTLVVSAPDSASPAYAAATSVDVTVTGGRFRGTVPLPAGPEPWIVVGARTAGPSSGPFVVTEYTLGLPTLGG